MTPPSTNALTNPMPPAPDNASSPVPAPHYRSVDFLRCGAVVLMIEAHVLNVMLRPELREGAAFRVVDYVNGLVAPAFLLTAGLVFALATGPATSPLVRRMSDLKTWGPRLALLWGLGYLLRAPGLWPPRPSSWSSAEWDTFLSVDVLHCIAAT